jgi:OFA family oxalate/formate antiporter-like MFS transporter
VVATCAALLFWPGVLAFGFPGLMAPVWQESFGVGRGAIGAVIFFALAGLGVANLLSSSLPARFSPAYRMLAGTLLTGLAVVLVVFADTMWQVYVWAFLCGFASILIYVPAVMLPQLALPRRRGVATGLVSTVFGLSAAIMTPLLGRLMEAFGYRAMSLTVLALTLLTGLAGLAFMRRSLAALLGANRSQRSPGRPETREPKVERLPGPASLQAGEAVKTRSFWALWFTWVLQGGAGIAMVTLAVGLGVSKGFTTSQSLVLLSAFNLSNGSSRIVAGLISDRLGRKHTISLAGIPAGLAYLALPHTGSLAATALLAGAVGFGFGSMFAVSAPLVGEAFGLRHFAAIFGLVMVAYGFVGSLLGPALSGYLLDLTGGDYALVLPYLGVFFLAGSMLVQLVRPARAG